MLTGSIVALVTPFTRQGNVDYSELEALVNWHVESGTDAIVAVGTTGESTTLTHDEHIDVVRAIAEIADSRIGVIAGNGSNSTAEAVHLTERMAHLNIDGFLNVTPYYNKPSRQGIIAHYQACASASDKPQILYNVPGRTCCDMQPSLVAELAQIDGVVGIKEASGEVSRVSELRQRCGAEFILLSGDDPTATDFMLAGGQGVISVTANVVPAQMKQLVDLAVAGQGDAAQQLDKTLQRLNQMLFIESNPIPVKWALALLGRLQANYRLPLTAPELASQKVIEQALIDAKLL
ncbi:4-hydroxy-tetrahydrodipicolinate synthase [Idiomarina xiamenensis]|uniref:4-hydroxy-tetrahydrodipicolinate synthase n=1 Tax=Idiomarina xiamenensis 10-D-4 TaxID=740709 RepID=K2LAL0_9GAMM|nr:4-hydroxy-tetrahydrodipicolinate synthase [Idiomarina xiamenensis]EKE86865.1 dihydrodipicolinate synthase [Idiomarina xiamenensis 10-D-4]